MSIAISILKYINPLTLCAFYLFCAAVTVNAEAEMFSELCAAIIVLGFVFPALVINLILNRAIRKLSFRITCNIIAAVVLYAGGVYLIGK